MEFLYYTDGHLRSDVPAKRLENEEQWIQNQLNLRRQMFEYAYEHKIYDIINGGDYFNGWRTDSTAKLLYELIKLYHEYPLIKERVCIGNHDLPNHRLDLIEKSNLGILQASGCITIPKDRLVINDVEFDFYHYTQPLKPRASNSNNRVAVIHDYIFEKTVPPYFEHGYTVKQLEETLTDYKLYLCGHNHEKFIVQDTKNAVINGGSFGRFTRTQGRHRTTFWVCNTGNQTYTPHEVQEDLSLLDTSKNSKNNTEVFVESTKDFQGEIFDFKKYVEDRIIVENIDTNVSEIVYKCIGD